MSAYSPPTGAGGAAPPTEATLQQIAAGVDSIDADLPADPAREGGNLATVATNTGRIPVQGQALAAASTPVVLPAAQESALKTVDVASSALPAGAATNATLVEVRDRLPPATLTAVPTLAAAGVAIRLVPSGAQELANSTAIVFATDHPPVDARLIIGASAAGPSNPVPVQGVTPKRTANGAIVPATTGLIVAGSAALLRLKVWYLGNLEQYIMLFDTVGAPADATLVDGSGHAVTITDREHEIAYTYGLSFSTGITWAISASPTTYVASTRTAVVAGQWSTGT